MIWEFVKFLFYSGLIVIISKYVLVTTLRKLAENLNLSPKTVGNIAGYATSMPELLTISISSLSGLISASVFNVLSSNVINLIQYMGAILLNKNQSSLRNKAIMLDIILVLITILIPIILIVTNVLLSLFLVPAFIILYFLFRFLNDKAHNLYLKDEDEKIEDEIEEEENKEKGNKIKTIKHVIILIIAGVLLFIVGDRLGNALENLCNIFNISQTIIGILLGFITSIPELITFFEAQKHHKSHNNEMLGVVEATNNLLTSNILNLFIIQSVGILIVSII